MGQGSCPPTPLARLLVCPPDTTDPRPHRVPVTEGDTAGLGALVHISARVFLPRDFALSPSLAPGPRLPPAFSLGSGVPTQLPPLRGRTAPSTPCDVHIAPKSQQLKNMRAWGATFPENEKPVTAQHHFVPQPCPLTTMGSRVCVCLSDCLPHTPSLLINP